METSLADIAAVTGGNNGFGNNGLWLFAILALMNGGFGWGNRNYGGGDFGQYATAASQQEILFGQQFNRLEAKGDNIANGIADATYALTNSLNAVGSKVDAAKYEAALGFASVNANIDNKFAALEKSNLEQRIAAQATQIQQLQLQSAMCGVVRYPMASAYYAPNPFCNCNSGCSGNI